MRASAAPIAGTDNPEENHVHSTSLIPSNDMAHPLGDERVPSLPPIPLAADSSTPSRRPQPKYAPVASYPERSSNLFQITFEQTFIMVWKNLQV